MPTANPKKEISMSEMSALSHEDLAKKADAIAFGAISPPNTERDVKELGYLVSELFRRLAALEDAE